MGLKVGSIGLGIMGSRMAANLRWHNYELVVFNRTSDKAESLLREGAMGTLARGSRGRSRRALMLAHPEAVAAAALGVTGFLSALRPGSIWANCGTVNPMREGYADQDSAALYASLNEPAARDQRPIAHQLVRNAG